MKYMVMECHPGYAVLLDEEGCFRKAANLRYEVGQTVEEPFLMKERQSGLSVLPGKRWISTAAAMAACAFLFFGFRYQVCGPDLEDETFNGMMGSVADTAADLGRQVMEELKNQHEKYNNRKK